VLAIEVLLRKKIEYSDGEEIVTWEPCKEEVTSSYLHSSVEKITYEQLGFWNFDVVDVKHSFVGMTKMNDTLALGVHIPDISPFEWELMQKKRAQVPEKSDSKQPHSKITEIKWMAWKDVKKNVDEKKDKDLLNGMTPYMDLLDPLENIFIENQERIGEVLSKDCNDYGPKDNRLPLLYDE
jgi:hypothetical protein